MTETLHLHLPLPPVRPFCVERKKVKCEIKIRDECQELREESFHLLCGLMRQPVGLTCYLKSCISSGTKITPQCFNLLRCWTLFKISQELPPHLRHIPANPLLLLQALLVCLVDSPAAFWPRSRCTGSRRSGPVPGLAWCPPCVPAGHTCFPPAPWERRPSPSHV